MIALQEPPITASPPKPSLVDELQKTVSASRLNCWLQCRLKFFFRYILQITKPPTAALYVGSVVHAVLKAWNKARWRKEPFQTEVFKQVFDAEWQDNQKGATVKWGDEEAGERTQAWSLLETYFLETPIKANERPEAVEVPVEADLASHGLPRLIGIIDLVRAGGRIVDFKTAGQTPQTEKALHQNEVQLSGYALLYREATGRQETGLELHHLVKLKTPKIVVTQTGPMTDQQRTRLFKLMDSYVSGLQRQDFVPSPGLQCSGCEFFNECRRWS